MAELRSQPRFHVLWNAAIRLPSKQVIRAKILNVSTGGLQFLCPENLPSGQKFEMQLHVPDLNGAGTTTTVPCFAECAYSILAGRDFRIGAKFSGMASEHVDLLQKWSERCARGAA